MGYLGRQHRWHVGRTKLNSEVKRFGVIKPKVLLDGDGCNRLRVPKTSEYPSRQKVGYRRAMGFAAQYVDVVTWVAGSTGYPDPILHIHGGMAVLLLTRIITRRSLATPWPMLIVIVAALAKEVADCHAYGRVKTDTIADILQTVFWPAVLFIGLRGRRLRQQAEPVERIDPTLSSKGRKN